MVADASIWRLSGSNRKSLEVGGSQRKELQKAESMEGSVEPMEIFTTSKKAPSTWMEGSINLHEKKHFY